MPVSGRVAIVRFTGGGRGGRGGITIIVLAGIGGIGGTTFCATGWASDNTILRAYALLTTAPTSLDALAGIPVLVSDISKLGMVDPVTSW